MRRILFALLIIASIGVPPILAALGSVVAYGHDWKRPDLDEWYTGLKRHGATSGYSFSCCSKTDCHTTEAELRGDDWWARIGVRDASGDWDLRDWVKVPAASVLQQHDNPTGEGVICHSMVWRTEGTVQTLIAAAVTIWCFIPPTES